MKHIKLFETFSDGIYNIEDIYSWWIDIMVTEDEEYYIIDLEDEYLTNKIFQLNSGLRGKTVNFYCENHKKHDQLKIASVEYNETYGKLIFKCESKPNNTVHVVDITKPIKISKLHTEIDKYNL